MIIYLKAGSELRERLKPDVDHYTRKVETEEGKSIRAILLDLGIDPAFVAFAYIDNTFEQLDYVPSEGQTITLQPPVSGG